MTPLPLAAAVAVTLDGRPVHGYAGAFELQGHVFAPVRPYVTRIADRLSYVDGRLAIERAGRIAYVRMAPLAPDALDRAYVPLRSVFVALGADVTYDGIKHVFAVTTSRKASLASPSPFNGPAPVQMPGNVFTPVPLPTERPTYTGPAIPRRTPIPYVRPSPRPSSSYLW